VNLLFTSSVLAINGKCRILALGGNSDRGPYQAGAIQGLINFLPTGEAQWDIVTGNGIGAIHALIMSQYALGSEAAAATQLNTTWLNFKPSQFYNDWAGGTVTGLLLEHGLFDSSPMDSYISGLNKGKYPRFAGVGGTDLISGNYVFFNTTLDTTTLNTGVKASMATAGYFPYVDFAKLELVTGAVKFAVDIFSGINYCTGKGYPTANITVDTVLCVGKSMTVVDATKYHTLDVLNRAEEIINYGDTMKIVVNAPHDYPNINMRTVIYPSQPVDNPELPYNYDIFDIKTMLALGYSDAHNATSKITANK